MVVQNPLSPLFALSVRCGCSGALPRSPSGSRSMYWGEDAGNHRMRAGRGHRSAEGNPPWDRGPLAASRVDEPAAPSSGGESAVGSELGVGTGQRWGIHRRHRGHSPHLGWTYRQLRAAVGNPPWDRSWVRAPVSGGESTVGAGATRRVSGGRTDSSGQRWGIRRRHRSSVPVRRKSATRFRFQTAFHDHAMTILSPGEELRSIRFAPTAFRLLLSSSG